MKIKPTKASETFGEDLSIAIHGPPKCGKTVTAATSSKYFTEFPRPKDSPIIELKDMLWLQLDNGATDTLWDSRYDVPVLSLKQTLQATNYNEARAAKLMIDAAKEHIKSTPECKFVVADTISLLDKAFVSRYSEVHEDSDNSFDVWRDVLNAHRRFHLRLKGLPVIRLYLFHSKAENEAVIKKSKAATDKKKANEANAGTIHPDITGQAITLYRGEVSAMLTQAAKKGPKGMSYILQTTTTGGSEAGKRFQLPDTIPANMRQFYETVGIMRGYYG